MGIDLICDTEHWSGDYNTWIIICNACVKATFEYIQGFIKNNIIQSGNEEKRLQTKILFHINKINIDVMGNEDIDLMGIFLEECKNAEFVELLTKFGVSGIYALCCKIDRQGYYSVGNSYDICDFFSLIKYFTLVNKNIINSSKNNIYRNINQIEIVFKESLELKRIVSIF